MLFATGTRYCQGAATALVIDLAPCLHQVVHYTLSAQLAVAQRFIVCFVGACCYIVVIAAFVGCTFLQGRQCSAGLHAQPLTLQCVRDAERSAHAKRVCM
jgi:Na+-transporting NADH:ubiquinone oxidoreductase subunit NqrE